MKKKYIYAGGMAMALAMTACSADEPISQNVTDGLIHFNVITANQTRAEHSYCANQMPEEFKVYADYTSETQGHVIYMEEDLFKRDGDVTSSTYNPVNNRYWPEEDVALNFYAYTDDNGTFEFNNGTPKFVDFEVDPTVAEQLDLMYAVNSGAKKADGDVELNFRHALSQICFRAKNANSKIKITVNSITVNNVIGKGTYNLPTGQSTTGNYTEHPTAPEATGSYTRGEWEEDTSLDADASYIVSPAKNLSAPDANGAVTTELTTFSNHAEGGYEMAMNLIPQENTAATTVTKSGDVAVGDGAFFTLNLTIENLLNNSDNGANTTVADEMDFYVPFNTTWNQGVRYIYTFEFSKTWNPEGLEPITYSVTTDDFISGNEIPVEYEEAKPKATYRKILMRKAVGTEGEDGYVPALYVADRNIGAENETDPGMYFAWGCTEGYYYRNGIITDADGNSVYTGDEPGMTFFSEKNEKVNSLYSLDLDGLVTKGVITSTKIWTYGQDNTNLSALTPEYDAATKLMGDTWHMINYEELDWLSDTNNCTWTAETINGKNGVRVTPKDETLTESIFLPYMDDLYDGPDLDEAERPSEKLYWTNVPDEDGKAMNISVSEDMPDWSTDYEMFFGFLVRGVSNTAD